MRRRSPKRLFLWAFYLLAVEAMSPLSTPRFLLALIGMVGCAVMARVMAGEDEL